MLENKLFEALLDVIPFKAYAVDVVTYEVVYANKLMRENMYSPQQQYCWEKVFGQKQICSWCSINKIKARDRTKPKEKHICEFFDETDDKWLKSYDELMSWPDGRDVKYSILVDITDQKEIQGDMIKSHAKLAMHSKQLKVTNKNLQITKLTLQKTVNELETQKTKAELATASKSQFLANMSHEIRTPMNAVIGMTHLLSQTPLDKKQKDYLEKIEISSKNLLNIINDILDFSKIEAGKLELDKIDFSLNELLQNVKNIVEQKANEKGITFNIYYEDQQDIFYGDPLRVGQILINIINNAIKFTEKGFVDFYIYLKEKNRIVFEIKDSGIGLSSVQVEKLFNSFAQADNSTTRKFGGTGLGLSISQQLANLMDGNISVKSQLDIGSTFIVDIELPFGNSNNIVQGDKKVSLQTIQNECQNIQGAKILLVEDNHINQEIVLSLLSPFDIEVDLAINGLEAVNIFKLYDTSRYHLILMDIQMPIMDGYEATSLIRQIDKNIPIVALSANAFSQDIEKTKKAGMNHHLNKPIEIDQLYSVLLKYLPKDKSKNTSKDDLKDEIILPEFDRIDTKSALFHLGGNKELYLKILKNFYEDYKELDLDNLTNQEFKITIHTIKGLSGNIGAKELYDITKKIDETKDKSLLEQFYKDLNKVISYLSLYFKIDKHVEVKEQLTIDKKSKIRLFSKLSQSIKTNRPRNIKPFIDEIENYILTDQDKKSFIDIKKEISSYRFKDAIKLIENSILKDI